MKYGIQILNFDPAIPLKTEKFGGGSPFPGRGKNVPDAAVVSRYRAKSA
jgi:hypothetical protein